MDSKGSRFIRYMVENDILEYDLSFDKSNSPVRCSPSKFTINVDYIPVPFAITIVPIAEARTEDVHWEAVIEQSLQSNDRLMVATVNVQRGRLISSTAFLLAAP